MSKLYFITLTFNIEFISEFSCIIKTTIQVFICYVQPSKAIMMLIHSCFYKYHRVWKNLYVYVYVTWCV